jgi:hypothetical protein
MKTTIKIFVDPKAIGSQALMEELSKQLTALKIGEVEEVKEKPPKGTLAVPDAETTILILTIVNLTVQITKALFEVIREARAKSAATLKQPLNAIPPVIVKESDQIMKVTSLNPTKKEQAFLQKIQSEEEQK